LDVFPHTELREKHSGRTDCLWRFAEKNCLTAEERALDGFEAGLNLGEVFEDPCAIAVFKRRTQQLALAD
jgi:hypothetical protein